MRSIRQLAWLRCIAACALVSVHCGFDRTRYVAERVRAEPIYRAAIALPGHAALTIETRRSSSGARPMLQLWDDGRRVEVARAQASLWGEAQLSFRNPDARAHDYTLFMRARDRSHRGHADLYRDGRLLVRAAAISGSFLHLQGGPGVVYQVAATPGGPHAAQLIGLGRDGEIVAIDERSGPTGLPSLPSQPSIDQLLLTPLTAAVGRFSVYANDALDRDGDGLGRQLERALGTCDSPADAACRRGPLAAYYQRVPNATRDSDRDGLSDRDELFGVDASALDLPRYGTDPRHKDVLVEIDHHASLDGIGFSETELSEIAALFAQGSANDLKNPDGRFGIAVHFDAGFSPSDPAHAALFGDFGGSGRARETDYHRARRVDFTPNRNGYFRYAFSTRKGRGQTSGDAFTVNRDLQRVTIFAHELGHTLGLSHAGSDAWGRANCKPNYFSIMNYLYQNRYEVGFSRHATRALHPEGVFERGGLPAFARPEWLREPPLELDVSGRDVDWNRDGTISDVAVRADLVWATYKSCGAAEHDQTTLSERDLSAATPVLVRLGDQLIALWLSERGSLFSRRLRVRGACGDDCERWSATEPVTGLDDLRFISGLALNDERLGLAYVRLDGAIGLATLQPMAAGLSLASDVTLPGRTEHDPSLIAMTVDPDYYGASRLLSVLFRADDGELWQASGRDAGGLFVLRRLLDGASHPIASPLGPSAIALPTGELCGAWTDRDGYVRFYGYAPKRDRWIDLSARAFDVGLGPRSVASPTLAYHVYRDATGAPIEQDETRGALYLSFSEPIADADYPANPQFLVSEWLSERHGVFEQISLRWRGRVINEWTDLAPESAVAMYEDASLSELKALLLVRNESAQSTHLDFLPHADGVFAETLAGGDDFQVMERGVCLGLHSERECGDANTR